jgi:hypothetical protein
MEMYKKLAFKIVVNRKHIAFSTHYKHHSSLIAGSTSLSLANGADTHRKLFLSFCDDIWYFSFHDLLAELFRKIGTD